MGLVTVGVIAVTVICLVIFAALSLTGLLGANGRQHW